MSDSWSLEYDEERSALVMAGEFGSFSADRLRAALEKHSNGWFHGLTVDLSDVSYLPSIIVGVLASAQRKARNAGATLDLVATDGSIAERVLRVSGLGHQTT